MEKILSIGEGKPTGGRRGFQGESSVPKSGGKYHRGFLPDPPAREGVIIRPIKQSTKTYQPCRRDDHRPDWGSVVRGRIEAGTQKGILWEGAIGSRVMTRKVKYLQRLYQRGHQKKGKLKPKAPCDFSGRLLGGGGAFSLSASENELQKSTLESNRA